MAAPLERDWEAMWLDGLNPGDAFDASVCHPALQQLLTSKTLLLPSQSPPSTSQRALVPGCGRGYEVCALASSGLFDSVVGLDLAPTGVAAARAHASALGGTAAERAVFVLGDFFDYVPGDGEGFGLVVDYTFLCAIPVDMREKWAEKMASLVVEGGMLLTLMFPLGKKAEEGGPPHGVDFELFETLLCPVGFEMCEPLKELVCTRDFAGIRSGGAGGRSVWKSKSEELT